MTIRAISIDDDYPILVKWWEGHKAPVMQKEIIPQGWIISTDGIDVAASFLLLDVGGKWAVIEFLTTNPAVSYSRRLVGAVLKLVSHVEAVARKQGCLFICSFIAPSSGEERLMTKIGYAAPQKSPHILYAKPLMPA